MRLSKLLSTALGLSLLLVFTLSCQRQNVVKTYSDKGYENYVYAYTSGVVSRGTPVRVRFTQPMVNRDQVGKAAKAGLLQLTPAVSGSVTWEDDRTLRFEPDNWLPSGQAYTGVVRLNSLFDNIPTDYKTFKFGFATIEQHIEVNLDGLQSEDASDLSKQALTGVVTTADWAEDADIEKIVQVTQRDNDGLRILWEHQAEAMLHRFRITGIERGKRASEVQIGWNGSVVNANERGNQSLEVPALGDFKVMDVQVKQDEDGASYLAIYFSDPLRRTQDLSGLIDLSNYYDDLTFTIDGNQVNAFVEGSLQGDYRVSVATGLKNSMGQAMQKASQWDINFEPTLPQVRFVHSGVILPNTQSLQLPFEAVGLRAVDVEIFKIYSNNVLQFLQTNALAGDYELQRVGKVVFQQTIELGTIKNDYNTDHWTAYGLDLSQYIEREPDAIYQVRLGFKRSHSVYNCNTNDDVEIERLSGETNAEGEISSFWDAYYGYFPYRERNNPCKDAYYKSYYRRDRFAATNLIASDIGLIAKRGKDNSLLVTANNILTTDPLEGIEVEVYDFQQQRIAQGRTDAQGFAEMQLPSTPFVVIAKAGKKRGYLKLQDGEALSMSLYEVAGSAPQRGLKGFIYGERGVWRPGDSLFLNFILEDKNQTLPADHPVTMELYDARGQLHTSRTIIDHVKHIYDFTTVTDAADPTGNWTMKVKVGGATFQKNLRIETVKPNRLKIDLDFGSKVLTARDQTLNGKLQVNWLHGAPGRNLKTNIKMQLRAKRTTFVEYPSFRFDDPAREFESEPITIFDQAVDNNGSGEIATNIDLYEQAPGMLEASFTSRAFEQGGDFSTDNLTLDYHPYASYVGVMLPEKRYRENRLDLNQDETLSFVVLDTDGKPIRNRKISVGLYKVEWNWWWDSDYNDFASFSSDTHYNAEQTIELTTDAYGRAKWTIRLSNWGRYLVRAIDLNSQHAAGVSFYAGYPWDGNDAGKEAAAMLTIQTDKERYNVGETITLNIPMGKAGRALVALENGTKVIRRFWVEAQDGENNITFEASAEMAPNVYAHVTFLQPHGQVHNDLPMRLYGVVPVMVEDPATRLTPVAQVKDAIRPNERFTVKVSESNRRAMAYTLAIVDEGLLDLTRFATPDPWQHFYAKEALGVQTWDLYNDVMGAYDGKLSRIFGIGGDMSRKPRGGQKANRFKPVVMHLGPFYLKEGTTQTHELEMPNYVGAVRVMVVAAHEGAYGHFEKSVKVKKPLMVLGTLPRVLGPGETVQLPVTVFAMEKNIKNVDVRIRTNGLLKVKGQASKSMKFNSIGDQIAPFELETVDGLGVASVDIEVRSGNEVATQHIELDVRNPNPYETRVQDAIVQAGGTTAFDVSPVGMKGSNKGILEVSHIPPINLGERLDYLLRYPHGCIEQTTSSGFPQLFVDKLIDLTPQQRLKVKNNVQATLDRLRHFQTPSGGLGYWPGNSEVSHWGTNYAGHFMLEAEKLGYLLPAALKSNWLNYQKRAARSWSPSQQNEYSLSNSTLTQAYRLYTLAMADAPDLGAMNRLREMRNLPNTARWRLAAAYAQAGKTAVAQSMLSDASIQVSRYEQVGNTYGSVLRDQAMILETLTLLNQKDDAAKLVLEMSKALSADQWHSTQTLGYTLLAVGKYAGQGTFGEKMTFAYNIGGGSINAGSTLPVYQIEYDGDRKGRVTVRNTGQSVLYARVIQSGQPENGQATAASNDLNLNVRYLSMAGDPINVNTLEQGTDFVAEVTVKHPGVRAGYNEMALMQVFPSGWEIYNTRLNAVQAFSNAQQPEYQDWRDDRVYTYFDLGRGQQHTYYVQLNASYQGRYYLPAVSCEAMYDGSINARVTGQWVNIVKPGTMAN